LDCWLDLTAAAAAAAVAGDEDSTAELEAIKGLVVDDKEEAEDEF